MDDSRTDDDLNDLRRTLLALLPGLALADAASAQDAAKMQPRAYRVAFENDKLRVLEYHSRPGMGVCGDGMHSHPAHLTVVLVSGKVRVKTARRQDHRRRRQGRRCVLERGRDPRGREHLGPQHARGADRVEAGSRQVLKRDGASTMHAPSALIAEDEAVLRDELQAHLARCGPSCRSPRAPAAASRRCSCSTSTAPT